LRSRVLFPSIFLFVLVDVLLIPLFLIIIINPKHKTPPSALKPTAVSNPPETKTNKTPARY
jgi:hypothetical protein